jgi:hypothetical protein
MIVANILMVLFGLLGIAYLVVTDERVIRWMVRRSQKTPYFHLGTYMDRDWLLPRWCLDKHRDGSWWLKPWMPFGIRLHHIKRSDAGRDLHDHPWWYLTIILVGEYWETTQPAHMTEYDFFIHRRTAGSVAFHSTSFKHRLDVPENRTALTLFIHGRKARTWGFHTDDGFVPHDKYQRKA